MQPFHLHVHAHGSATDRGSGDIPEIKKLIRSTTVAHAERVAKRALSFETDRQVSNYLRDETRKIMPDAL